MQLNKSNILIITSISALFLLTPLHILGSSIEYFYSQGICWDILEDETSVLLNRITSEYSEKNKALKIPPTVTNIATGKSYNVTEIGSGYLSINYDSDSIAVIPNFIQRINDSAFRTYSKEHTITIEEGNNIKYLGFECVAKIKRFIVNTECELNQTGASVGYMRIGFHIPKILKDWGTAFNFIDTLECTSTVPLDFEMGDRLSPYLRGHYNDGHGNYIGTLLIIPDGTKDAYLAHPFWGNFFKCMTKTELKEYEAEYNAHNFFTYNAEGEKAFHFLINQDEQTVTLVSGFETVAAKTLDLSQPVVNPTTGKSYVITRIGNGEKWASDTGQLYITPNIEELSDGAYANILIPNNNTTLKRIGYGAVNCSTSSLYIPTGCSLSGLYNSTIPDYVRIGDNVTFYWESEIYPLFRNPKIIRCESAEPPALHCKLFYINGIDVNHYKSSTLYVPKGSKEAYAAHPEWGKIPHIYEYDKPVVTESIDLDLLEPTDYTFSITTKSKGMVSTDVKCTFAVNKDDRTVTQLRVEYDSNTPIELDLSEPVNDPATGISYPISAAKGYLATNLVIPKNIIKIYNNAFSAYNIKIDDPNSLMYVGHKSLNSSESIVSKLTINDGCVFNSVQFNPQEIMIGNIETIGSGECIFPLGMYTTASSDPIRNRKITCSTAMPPVVIGHLFPSIAFYNNTTLYVPYGALEAYKNAPEWKRIGKIVELEPAAVGEPIVNTIVNDLTISVIPRQLTVTVNTESDIAVMDIAGRIVKSAHLYPGQNTLDIPSGLYIVSVPGHKPAKIAIQ